MVSPRSLSTVRLRALGGRLAQSQPVVGAARRADPGALRILALHGVPDVEHFAGVVDEIIRLYRPVSGHDVARALAGDAALPRYPVWFTFDDGLSSTLGAAGLLASRGVTATAFVCPGVMDPPVPHWFQLADAALRRGDQTLAPKPVLKTMRDDDRRRVVSDLTTRSSLVNEVLDLPGDEGALRAWVDQGHEVGNHTWDHPLLDRCSDKAQRDQVRAAHAWLSDRGFNPEYLAYPNGNWAASAADEAVRLGYRGSLLFDHRVSRRPRDPSKISRLRLDSTASLPRVRSILSGAHSALFHRGR